MADTPTTTESKNPYAWAEEALANAMGYEKKKAADPLDKTVAESRFVTVGGRAVRRNPIGVETGYQAPFTGQRMPDRQLDLAQGWQPETGIGARYDATDLDLFANLAPERIAEIQSGLARAGLLPKKGTAYKIWDGNTAGAMQKVLAYANQRGLVWQDALEEWGMAADESGMNDPGPGRVFTPRLSNPDDLRATFKQVAYQRTGGNFLDDAAYERMVAAYQDAEMKAQRGQFDAAVSGATVVDAPSAQTFAEGQLQDTATADVEANSVAQYGKVLEGMMGSWQ
jgi:hypothetical protein